MIEETIELEDPEVIEDSEETIVPVEDDECSIVPALVGFGGVAALCVGAGVAIKKSHLLGRMKSFVTAGVDAFKNYEVAEESEEVESHDVEVETTEDPAE